MIFILSVTSVRSCWQLLHVAVSRKPQPICIDVYRDCCCTADNQDAVVIFVGGYIYCPHKAPVSKVTWAITRALVTMILVIRNSRTFVQWVAKLRGHLAWTRKNSTNNTAPCCKNTKKGTRTIWMLQWNGWTLPGIRVLMTAGLPICLPCPRPSWSRYARFSPRAWHQGNGAFFQ